MVIFKRKKGQMKVQQMAFMIVGLVIFFVLVGLFVLNFAFSGLKTSKANLDEQRATLLVQGLAGSSEFSCGNAFGTGKVDCIDMDKIFALQNYAKDYAGFWGVGGIEIRKLYPLKDSSVECTSSTYPNCGHVTILASKTLGMDESAYVSLCRKADNNGTLYDQCDLGELILRVSNG